MDAQEKLILQSTYSVGIIATDDLNSFEMVKPGEADCEARKADSRRRGMCRYVGMLVYLPGGFTQFALDVPISEGSRKILEFVFVNHLKDMAAAWQERRKGSADWLERLGQLPDTRV